MASPALTLVVETSVPPEPESVRSLTATEVEPPLEELNPLLTTPPTPPPTRAAARAMATTEPAPKRPLEGFFCLGGLLPASFRRWKKPGFGSPLRSRPFNSGPV